MANTFGTLVDPAHFVEVPDPANPTGPPGRPPAGYHILVQNYANGVGLPDIVTTAYGYWAYTTGDTIPQIRVSVDGGATWVGPLISIEAQAAAATSGVNASEALANSQTAVTTANEAKALALGGGGTTSGSTFTGTVDWNTQVQNKPDLTVFMRADQRGALNGVAPLASGLVPIGNLPVGTGAQQVAVGNHPHTFTVGALPGRTGVRLLLAVEETAPGTYPTLTAEELSLNLKRAWYGSVRPTTTQGLKAGDDWVNTAP